MVTYAITGDKISFQFILQLTEIGLWKYGLLTLEDKKMRKSFCEKEFSQKTWKSFAGKDFLYKNEILPGKKFLKKKDPKNYFTKRIFFFFFKILSQKLVLKKQALEAVLTEQTLFSGTGASGL